MRGNRKIRLTGACGAAKDAGIVEDRSEKVYIDGIDEEQCRDWMRTKLQDASGTGYDGTPNWPTKKLRLTRGNLTVIFRYSSKKTKNKETDKKFRVNVAQHILLKSDL